MWKWGGNCTHQAKGSAIVENLIGSRGKWVPPIGYNLLDTTINGYSQTLQIYSSKHLFVCSIRSLCNFSSLQFREIPAVKYDISFSQ